MNMRFVRRPFFCVNGPAAGVILERLYWNGSAPVRVTNSKWNQSHMSELRRAKALAQSGGGIFGTKPEM
jgi:hypothetical protein